MKPKRMLQLLLFSIVFLVGVLAGAVIQKTIGVGNVLRAVGIPYPISVPPGDTDVLSTVEIPETYRGQMSLFILAGQSNMVGWAPIPENEEINPRIYVFSNDYHWRIAREPVDNAYNQVDQVSLDRIAFFGSSLAFASASLERHPDIVIGLIPCAKNSSAIAQWQRNLSDQSLYGSCLKRARAASPMGRISGILFLQGETDAQDPVLYPQPEPRPFDWSSLFTTFITDLRNDLHEPELPVVFARLGSIIQRLSELEDRSRAAIVRRFAHDGDDHYLRSSSSGWTPLHCRQLPNNWKTLCRGILGPGGACTCQLTDRALGASANLLDTSNVSREFGND